MDYLLATLLSYLLLYKYVAVSVVSFLAGLILPLPSNALLLAAGAFASQGYISATAVFFFALVSNVLGDSLSYALTRFWGTRIITETRLKRFSAVVRIEQFVRQHARPTILLTRFFGTPGVVANFLCGLLGVPFRRFVVYDIIGNALDIVCFILVGYGLGVYTENYSDIAQLVGWIILIAVLIFLVFKLFLNKNTYAKLRRR